MIRFNGSEHRGELASISNTAVFWLREKQLYGTDIATAPRIIFNCPRAEEDRRADGEAAEPAQRTGEVVLRDGSRLPLTAVRGFLEAGVLTVTLPVGAAFSADVAEGGDPAQRTGAERDAEESGPVVYVPVDAISSIRLPGGDPRHAEAWQKLIDSHDEAEADRLVTSPRGAGSLDYLEGYLESLDAASATIIYQGEPLVASASRVYGILLAKPQRRGNDKAEAPAKPRRVGPHVSTRSGMLLISESLSLRRPGELAVVTRSGLSLLLPLAEVSEVNFIPSHVAFLSDLPARSSTRPLFGLPAGLPDAVELPAVQRDRAYWGGPLTVRRPQFSQLRKTFSKGLAVRTGGQIEYDLGGEFRALQATVGFAARDTGLRSVKLQIEVDGKLLCDRKLKDTLSPLELQFPVARAQKLVIRVERLEGLDGVLNLGDARLMR